MAFKIQQREMQTSSPWTRLRIQILHGREKMKTSEGKNLGIIVDTNLKFVQHINTKVKTASQMFDIINRSLNFMDKEMLLILFKTTS